MIEDQGGQMVFPRFQTLCGMVECILSTKIIHDISQIYTTTRTYFLAGMYGVLAQNSETVNVDDETDIVHEQIWHPLSISLPHEI